MFKNYLKVGIRNIRKYKAFSFINIFGLAIAMTVGMLIITMLADQRSYDQFNAKKDRIYRIISDEDNSKAPNAVTPFPLAGTLKANYPIVEVSTRLTRGIGGDVVYKNHSIEMRGYFADQAFFEVFDFELEKGDPKSALAAPNSVVLTSDYARRLFDGDDPIGKTVEFFDRGLPNLGDDTGNPRATWGLYKITGVIANKNYRSHLQFDALVSSSSIYSLAQSGKISDFTTNWQGHQSYTYALLIPSKNVQDLNALLYDVVSRQYSGPNVPKGFKLMGQKLTEITPGILVRNAPSNSLPLIAYYFLGLLALVIMLSACLNYTNLSIARALTRAKEIGVRKITGAVRKNLVFQFLSESVLTALLALVMAANLLILVKSGFMSLWVNTFLNFELRENFAVYFSFTGFALVIGVVAGIYPAFHLSKYQPLKVLKSLESPGRSKLSMRKVMSVSQFVISLFFITTSILIYNQFKHYLEFEYGFDAGNVINIPLQGNDYRIIMNELNKVPGVSSISASDIIPATNVENGVSLRTQGSEDEYKKFNIVRVDENFINNLDITLVAGRNLPSPGEGSERFVLVNEAAAKAFGFQDPSEMIGHVFDSKWSDDVWQVIGIVEDFHFRMLMNHDKIGPLVLQNQPSAFRYVNLKIATADLAVTIKRLENKWMSIDPLHAFEYEFYDQQLASQYRIIFDVVSVLGFIAFLAIVIACLGMLGMTTYTAQRRTKEVGIRKVLGAKNLNIAFLLSKEFLDVLLVAILIGVPLSYFINNAWLQNLPNRVVFGFGTVLLGTIILLFLGLITIGSQTLRAVRSNPVEALRYE